jgi:hypothetical protein
MTSYPIPTGVGFSVSPVPKSSVASRSNTIGPGYAIVTFQPFDVNCPGVLSLYDSADNLILTMDRAGYENVLVPDGGLTYYFKATLGAQLAALTQPSVWR